MHNAEQVELHFDELFNSLSLVHSLNQIVIAVYNSYFHFQIARNKIETNSNDKI